MQQGAKRAATPAKNEAINDAINAERLGFPVGAKFRKKLLEAKGMQNPLPNLK